MDEKNSRLKLFVYKLEYLFFLLLGNLFTVFGTKSINFNSKILALIFFNILHLRKNVVLKNLKTAFPNLTVRELKNIAFKNYQSIAITFLELFNSRKLSEKKILEMVTIPELDLIKKKYSEGKGVILLTGHFGNWELAALAMGLLIDANITVLAKPQSNPYVTKWLTHTREKFGNKEIQLGLSVKEIFKSLRNKEIVGVVGDQRGPKDGVRVNFFDKSTATFPGTAAIALKVKCPVIVLFNIRKPDGKYKAVVKEIDLENLTGTDKQKIIQFNQKYMELLEQVIKQHPEQWFWMHNIWKY